MGSLCSRKHKIPEYQNGHAYLTTHRACYIDDEDPRRKAVGVDLKDVDSTEFYVSVYKGNVSTITDHIEGWFHQIIGQNHLEPTSVEADFSSFKKSDATGQHDRSWSED